MHDVIRVDESFDDDKPCRPGPAVLALPTQSSLGVRVRDARPDDLAFIDTLQKKHSKAVGWMPTGQLEGHIAKGHVVIAEAIEGVGRRLEGVASSNDQDPSRNDQWADEKPQNLTPIAKPIGYCIGVDKYFKREEAGIIYQMNIDPEHQRGLIGATLLQAMFDRWPYGVQLCCCWCAQDLQANYFWEAMGFVPLAFRSGSKKRDRVHIFWQKQIRKYPQGASGGGFNSGGGGWWFPSQTGGGAIREDRIVLPIPPGTHWSDAKPRIYPEVSGLIESSAKKRKALEAPIREAKRTRKRKLEAAQQAKAEEAAALEGTAAAGGLRFKSATPVQNTEAKGNDGKSKTADQMAVTPSKPKPKNDPRLVAAARELRDRWLEHAAEHPGLIEQGNTAARRYDVGRCVDHAALAIDALPLEARSQTTMPPATDAA